MKSYIFLSIVLLALLCWNISLLPNAVDNAFGINECVKCHDHERGCYFQE